MNTTVRKTKPAGELEGGDWLAADEHCPTPVRVLTIHTYLHDGSPSALITVVGPNNIPFSFDRFADTTFELATAGEIATTKSRGHRQQLVTELRQLAEILGAAPAPVERTVLIQLHADSRAEVRALGEHLGIEPEPRFSKGLQVTWPKGRQPYDDGVCAIWSTDKSEAEDPEPEPADPTGQLYSREADDPTPVSGARVEPHVGGMTDGGLLVDETPAEPVHMDFTSGESMCGLAATTPHKRSLGWRHVTCKACISQADES